jgi:hypothetical protein
METKLCRTCRFFKPLYFEIGHCTKQESPNSQTKMFTDDTKAGILVHITFGCIQWEAQPPQASEIL